MPDVRPGQLWSIVGAGDEDLWLVISIDEAYGVCALRRARDGFMCERYGMNSMTTFLAHRTASPYDLMPTYTWALLVDVPDDDGRSALPASPMV